jgi:hypothetical protein
MVNEPKFGKQPHVDVYGRYRLVQRLREHRVEQRLDVLRGLDVDRVVIVAVLEYAFAYRSFRASFFV